jgi:hypothetical protein
MQPNEKFISSCNLVGGIWGILKNQLHGYQITVLYAKGLLRNPRGYYLVHPEMNPLVSVLLFSFPSCVICKDGYKSPSRILEHVAWRHGFSFLPSCVVLKDICPVFPFLPLSFLSSFLLVHRLLRNSFL